MDYLPEPAIGIGRTRGGNAAFHNFNNDYSHITDANLRRRLALSEVDKIPFGWVSPTSYKHLFHLFANLLKPVSRAGSGCRWYWVLHGLLRHICHQHDHSYARYGLLARGT